MDDRDEMNSVESMYFTLDQKQMLDFGIFVTNLKAVMFN